MVQIKIFLPLSIKEKILIVANYYPFQIWFDIVYLKLHNHPVLFLLFCCCFF